MTRMLPIPLLLAAAVRAIHAQTNAFTRQVECPSDPSIMGYVIIPDLNDDMRDELVRVTEGSGDRPDGGYDLRLCPDGAIFSAANDILILPLLDEIRIICGGAESADPVCLIDGFREQVLIQNSMVDDYTINKVLFRGLTFTKFRLGTSITIDASPPTVATFENCVWQDFKDLSTSSI